MGVHVHVSMYTRMYICIYMYVLFHSTMCNVTCECSGLRRRGMHATECARTCNKEMTSCKGGGAATSEGSGLRHRGMPIRVVLRGDGRTDTKPPSTVPSGPSMTLMRFHKDVDLIYVYMMNHYHWWICVYK